MAPGRGELLFFDTFSHEIVELNLDLVQFPSPVIVEEVRVIPLGARVEANFPGGVRLGATNPTQFTLECFVNDLGRPGAANFENLGVLQYHKDSQIHLPIEKGIPTDGLVLRGMYNAITLAVYGTLTSLTAEQIAQDAANAQQAALDQERQAQQVVANHQPPTDNNGHANHVNHAPNHIPVTGYEFENERPASGAEYRQQQQEVEANGHHYEQRHDRDRDRDHRRYNSSERSKSPLSDFGGRRASNRERGVPDRSLSPGSNKYSSPPPHADHHDLRARSSDRSRESRERSRDLSHDRIRDRSRDRERDRERDRISPETRRPRRQPSVASNSASVKDDMLEDMSDISDGDIPEVEDVLEAPLSKDMPVKQERVSVSEDAVPASKVEEDVAMEDATEVKSESRTSKVKLGDMEEISDDEAGWSDGGGPDGERPRADYDFEDWEDPIKIIDAFSIDLSEVSSPPGETPWSTDSEELQKVKECLGNLAKTALNLEWVSEVETLTSSLEALRSQYPSGLEIPADISSEFLSLARTSLCLESARSHPQPTTLIRHLKSGHNLVQQMILLSPSLAEALVGDGVQERLFDLLSTNLIATSIQLRSTDLLLETLKFSAGFEFFVNQGDNSLYSRMFSAGKTNNLRLKEQFENILERTHFTASVRDLDDVVSNSLGDESFDLKFEAALGSVEMHLERALRTESEVALPLRTRKVPLRTRDLTSMLKKYKLPENILLLMSHQRSSLAVKNFCSKIIERLLKTLPGIDLLTSNQSIVNSLVKFFMEPNESASDKPDDLEPTPEEEDPSNLGVALAYKSLGHLLTSSVEHVLYAFKRSNDFDSQLMAENLQTLYGMTFTATGKVLLGSNLLLGRSEVMSNMLELSNIFLSENDTDEEYNEKAAVRGYSLELFTLALKHSKDVFGLEKVRKAVDDLVSSAEDEEKEEIKARYSEVNEWLATLRGLSKNQDLTPFCETFGKAVEATSNSEPVTPKLIQIARAFRTLVGKGQTSAEKEAVLNLYRLNFLENAFEILKAILSQHEQPHTHKATFACEAGLLLIGLIGDIVAVVKVILAVRSSASGTEIKDICFVTAFFQLHVLATAVPAASVSRSAADSLASDVVEALSILTIPVQNSVAVITPSDTRKSPGVVASVIPPTSSTTSVWAAMVRELFHFSVTTPRVYDSSLKMLSELLPLPTSVGLDPLKKLGDEKELENRTQKLTKVRKLWSVHLMLIETDLKRWLSHFILAHNLVPEAFPRVVVQLADLSTAVVDILTKSMVETLFKALEAPSGSLCLTVRSLEFCLRTLDNNQSVRISFAKLFDDAVNRELVSKLVHFTEKFNEDGEKTEAPKLVQLLSLEVLQLVHILLIASPRSKEQQTAICEVATRMVLRKSTARETKIFSAAIKVFEKLTSADFGLVAFKQSLGSESNFLANVLANLASSERPESFMAFANFVASLEQRENRTLHLESGHFKTLLGANEDLQASLKDLEVVLKESAEATVKLTELREKVAKWTACEDQPQELEAEEPVEGEGTSENDPDSIDWNEDAIGDLDLSSSVDILNVADDYLPKEFSLVIEVRKVLEEAVLKEGDKNPEKISEKSALEQKAAFNKSLISNFRAGGAINLRGHHGGHGGHPHHGGRGFPRLGQRPDGFRSRPPNTSRPPSLHVDDFLVLQQRGQQPTGPTGYNKQSLKAAKELFAEREAQHSVGQPSNVGFREATSEPVYDNGVSSRPEHPRGEHPRGGDPRGEPGARPRGPPMGMGGPPRGMRPRGWSPGNMDDRRHRRGPWQGDRRGPPPGGLKDRRKGPGGPRR